MKPNYKAGSGQLLCRWTRGASREDMMASLFVAVNMTIPLLWTSFYWNCAAITAYWFSVQMPTQTSGTFLTLVSSTEFCSKMPACFLAARDEISFEHRASGNAQLIASNNESTDRDSSLDSSKYGESVLPLLP
jgi:hypothetical protein